LKDRIADVQYYDQRRKREGSTIENPNVSTQSTNKKDRRPLSDFQK